MQNRIVMFYVFKSSKTVPCCKNCKSVKKKMSGTRVKDLLTLTKAWNTNIPNEPVVTFKAHAGPLSRCWSLVAHLDSTWALQRGGEGRPSGPDGPHQHEPEHKHGSGLVESRETPVYLWTCLGLGHNYRKIDSGGEGQRWWKKGKGVTQPNFCTCGWASVWSDRCEIRPTYNEVAGF